MSGQNRFLSYVTIVSYLVEFQPLFYHYETMLKDCSQRLFSITSVGKDVFMQQRSTLSHR